MLRGGTVVLGDKQCVDPVCSAIFVQIA